MIILTETDNNVTYARTFQEQIKFERVSETKQINEIIKTK